MLCAGDGAERRKNVKKQRRIRPDMKIGMLRIAGIFCLLYFVMLRIRVGAQTFFYIFPLMALGCFCLAFVMKQNRKGKWSIPRKWILAFRIVMGIGILTFAILLGMILHGQYVGPKKDADYLIVLGAGLRGDKPSIVLQNRIDAAAEYLKEYPGSRVVVSGGQGSDELISEAEAMRRGLVAKGIEEERIKMEEQSTSTRENLMFSDVLIPDDASVVIVTNKFHVFRACHLAKECGYTDVSGLGADNVVWLNLTNYIRECMAVLKDVVF